MLAISHTHLEERGKKRDSFFKKKVAINHVTVVKKDLIQLYGTDIIETPA